MKKRERKNVHFKKLKTSFTVFESLYGLFSFIHSFIIITRYPHQNLWTFFHCSYLKTNEWMNHQKIWNQTGPCRISFVCFVFLLLLSRYFISIHLTNFNLFFFLVIQKTNIHDFFSLSHHYHHHLYYLCTWILLWYRFRFFFHPVFCCCCCFDSSGFFFSFQLDSI